MTISEQLKAKRQEVLDVAASHGGRSLSVFGSIARGDARSNSDLDLLVRLDPGYSLLDLIAIKQDLEDSLGCKVAVVTEAALSRYIREQVLLEAMSLCRLTGFILPIFVMPLRRSNLMFQ